MLGIITESLRYSERMLFPEKDDLSELKSVTFMLLSMCDFFAFVLKMEAP